MSFSAIVGQFFSAATSSIIDSLGTAIDKVVTSDEERLEVNLKLQKVMADLQDKVMVAHNIENQELTKRLEADMKSDSWLSKNIRPVTLVFVTVAVTTLSFATIFGDLSETQVAALQVWTGFWTAVSLTVYGFYFGSRGLEKIASAVSDRWVQKEEKKK